MYIIQAHEEGRAEGFTAQERTGARLVIFDSIVSQMKVLTEVAIKEEMDFENEEVGQLARRLAQSHLSDLQTSSPEIGAMIKRLWAEEAMKITYSERDRLFNLNDGAGYLWDAIDRIYAPDYIPSEEDLLRVRIRTIGFDEATFTYKKSKFRVVDVGGQRTERRRWLEILQASTAVIFVASLCEYDQRLREDFDASRFQETTHLFTELLDSGVDDKAVIVLLNKLDLFKAKLAGATKKNFANFFKKYDGPLEWERCLAFLRQHFAGLAAERKVKVSIHAITAVETDSVKLVWTEIRNAIVSRAVNAAFGSI